MLEVRLLGEFDVRRNGTPIAIPSRAAQSLLGYLLLNPGTAHRREKLAGLLWPDTTEENARSNLRHELWRLRQAIESAKPHKRQEPFLLVDEISIAFNNNSGYLLDVAILQRENDSANDLIQALSVYRGELLPGFYDEWVLLERERLRAIFEQKMARLLDFLCVEKRWQPVLEWSERWIALGQTPEPAYRALMVAHSALGDMAKVAATFERCARALQNDLGVEPSEQTRTLYEQLTAAARAEDTKARAPTDRPPSVPPPLPAARTNNLPVPLTSFIGRKHEIAEVKRLLSSTRLLTLTGSGGVGKTRLAIQVATDLKDDFKDGVWWVDLVALADPALVPQAVARALDLHEVPNQPLDVTVADYLCTKQLLLVLDNCEHLLAACASLAERLLSASPHLKIVTTSREALGIFGEVTWRVPSLSLPDLQHPVQKMIEFGSVRLFVDRAAAVKPHFALTDQNVQAVAQICERLDGIPLAIELAAARMNVLSPEEIAARLGDRFNLLNVGSRTALPRQQTLRAAMDWSYELLTEPERTLFRRLSVFAGGFALEAAEAVTASSSVDPFHRSNVLDLLAQLANKSLVNVEAEPRRPFTQTRYSLLETIREYALGKLEEMGEARLVRDHHLEFFLQMAEEGAPKFLSGEQVVWYDQLEREHGNIRAAIEWSLKARKVEEALRLTGSLAKFFYTHTYVREGLACYKHILSQPEASRRTILRARALNAAGFLQWGAGNFSEARDVLEQALGIARELGDKTNTAWALVWLGDIVQSQGDYRTGQSLLEEALTTWRDLGSAGQYGAALSLAFLGDVPFYQGDYARAQVLYEEGASLLRKLGEKNLLGFLVRRSGYVALHQGDYGRASTLCTESLMLNIQVGAEQGVAACLAGLASVALAQGQTDRASKLFGAAQRLLEELAVPLHPLDRLECDRYVAVLRAQLDEAPFDAAWQEGRGLTMEQAVEYALEDKSK